MFSVTPGVIPGMSESSPIDFFRLFFSDRVLDLIYTETTCYASQYLEREREHLAKHPQARAHDWRKAPLTRKEVEVFLALLIGMGLCGFPTLRYLQKEKILCNMYLHVYIHVHVYATIQHVYTYSTHYNAYITIAVYMMPIHMQCISVHVIQIHYIYMFKKKVISLHSLQKQELALQQSQLCLAHVKPQV